jgi:hypothetical protein
VLFHLVGLSVADGLLVAGRHAGIAPGGLRGFGLGDLGLGAEELVQDAA